MKTTCSLLAFALLCFVFAACSAPPAALASGIAAVAASAMAIVEAVSPMLSPEALAKLQATAAGLDGTVEATRTAVATIADAIVAMKASVGAELAARAPQVSAPAVAIAALPSRTEVYASGTGATSAAVGASRLLSHFKHLAPSRGDVGP